MKKRQDTLKSNAVSGKFFKETLWKFPQKTHLEQQKVLHFVSILSVVKHEYRCQLGWWSVEVDGGLLLRWT